MQLVVTTAARDRLDPTFGQPLSEPSLAELVDATAGADEVWLTGGEPTLRADLPAVIGAIDAPVGLVTDGLALTADEGLSPLCEAGLLRVRLRLHAARLPAHDWLVQMRGAGKRAIRAAKRCRERGLELELEARLARPTMTQAHLLVELAHELGARAVQLYPVTASESDDTIALVARMGLLRPYVERAAAAARSRRVALRFIGFPRCALGEAALRPEVTLDPATQLGVRCRRCDDGCSGFPMDYVERFGLAEIDLAPAASDVVEIDFGEETTRELRTQLVRIAKHGPRELHVVGASMAHPERAALLRECTLLGFERVHVSGLAHGLDALTDAELYALSEIDHICGIFFAEGAAEHDEQAGAVGAFEAAVRGLSRFAAVTGRPVSAVLLRGTERVEAPQILGDGDA